jgi:hypothetical protein
MEEEKGGCLPVVIGLTLFWIIVIKGALMIWHN